MVQLPKAVICFSCPEHADYILAWGKHKTPYCDGCADSIVHQVEEDGFKVSSTPL